MEEQSKQPDQDQAASVVMADFSLYNDDSSSTEEMPIYQLNLLREPIHDCLSMSHRSAPVPEPVNSEVGKSTRNYPSLSKPQRTSRKVSGAAKMPSGDPPTLHQVCHAGLQSETDLEVAMELLRLNPAEAARPEKIVSRELRDVWDPTQGRMVKKAIFVKSLYSYPFNLAVRSIVTSSRGVMKSIDHDGNLELEPAAKEKILVSIHFLKLLLKAAPQVLSQSDGSMDVSPLAILIKELAGLSRDLPLLRKGCLYLVHNMVKLCPILVLRRDRHSNTLLHLACQQGAPLPIIEMLYSLDPTAVKDRNWHDRTPLEVASERNGAGHVEQELVVNFLRRKSKNVLSEVSTVR